MNTNSGRALALVLAGGLAILGLGEIRAMGNAPAPALAAAKSAVGIINLEKLMEKLNETKVLNEEMKAEFDSRQKELDDLAKRVTALETEVKTIATESKEYRQKMGEYQETRLLANARREILQKITDVDNGDLIHKMYNKIIASVDAFAQKEGFDLILLDDRGIKLPTNATPSQVNGAIQAKRILFAAESIDITDRIAKLMNAEYAAPAKR
ncbi:MAG: hypothetical protein AMXMBFR58_18940 [Phycisphaerae bacterium]|nr:hypothetical protein [Phycisphaerales bacterium]